MTDFERGVQDAEDNIARFILVHGMSTDALLLSGCMSPPLLKSFAEYQRGYNETLRKFRMKLYEQQARELSS